jgi:peptidoglycan hydrolase-like protein with peptidoglycan-binding domain
MMMRVLTHHREIIEHWHRTVALLQKLGLVGAEAAPMRATHTFDVEWVQESLNTLVDADLEVDGEIGPETVKAVKKYQGLRGLDVDGWLGVLTLSKLEEDMSKRR